MAMYSRRMAALDSWALVRWVGRSGMGIGLMEKNVAAWLLVADLSK